MKNEGQRGEEEGGSLKEEKEKEKEKEGEGRAGMCEEEAGKLRLSLGVGGGIGGPGGQEGISRGLGFGVGIWGFEAFGECCFEELDG